MEKVISIGIVDDHELFRLGAKLFLKSTSNKKNQTFFNVVLDAENGKDFINKLAISQTPDIVLLDVNMPIMDGFETMQWIKTNHPEIKVLALSMYDDENTIIKMLKNGASGYLLKDSSLDEIKKALVNIKSKGFYFNDIVTGKLILAMNQEENGNDQTISLSEREIQLLKLLSTELTYKEIADKMFISPRTVDGFRDELFKKLNVKTRVGLVMYAIKNQMVKL